MISRAKLHAYWRNPPAKDVPERYLMPSHDIRSQALLTIFEEIGVDRSASVLEIGCNAGCNLRHLWNAGYHCLYGIEINRAAVDLMVERYPGVWAQVANGPVEDLLAEVPPVDVIFTMAVLMHLHPDSEFVFGEMAGKTRKYLLTIENESTMGPRHHARNYQAVFEGLGMQQVWLGPAIQGLNPMYVARAFRRRV
jgi:SAM-dependent methyltransferase